MWANAEVRETLSFARTPQIDRCWYRGHTALTHGVVATKLGGYADALPSSLSNLGRWSAFTSGSRTSPTLACTAGSTRTPNGNCRHRCVRASEPGGHRGPRVR